MEPIRRRTVAGLACALTAALAAAAAPPALAQAAPTAAEIAAWPTRPVRIVVPYGPGISPDVVARILGDKLAQLWRQPVLIDNRPGASGIIGAELAAKSPGDGYTLLISVSANMAMNPSLYPKLPYDPVKDFKPVTHVLNVPFVLTAAPGTSFSTVQQLVDAARAKPGSIDYASLGPGSHAHVATEFLSNRVGMKLNHVPYKSSPAGDLMSGTIALYLDPMVTAAPLVQSKRIKALGVSSARRSPVLPDVPTIAETVPGFETYAFQGIFAPAATPDALVEKISADFQRVVRMPDVQAKLTDAGYIPVGSNPAEMVRLLRDELAQWARVIRDNNIKLD